MALSEVIIPSDGVTTLLTVDFALGYIEVGDVTCRAGTEVDGGGNPVYRTFTFQSATLVQVDGVAPPIGQNWVFKRTVVKDELIVNWEDGDAITGANLDKAQKQALMMAHEAIDAAATAVKTADGSEGPTITIGTENATLTYDADGNIVPGPSAASIDDAVAAAASSAAGSAASAAASASSSAGAAASATAANEDAIAADASADAAAASAAETAAMLVTKFDKIGGTITGVTKLEGTNPRLDWHDTDSPTGAQFASVNLVNGLLETQKRDDAGVFVSSLDRLDMATGNRTLYGDFLPGNDGTRTLGSTVLRWIGKFSDLMLTGAAGTVRSFKLATSGVARWKIGMGSGPESGGNAGSTFVIWRCDDAGNDLTANMTIDRSNGDVGFNADNLRLIGGTSTMIEARAPSTSAAWFRIKNGTGHYDFARTGTGTLVVNNYDSAGAYVSTPLNFTAGGVVDHAQRPTWNGVGLATQAEAAAGGGGAGVTSFAGRTGAVTPTAGDYNTSHISYSGQTQSYWNNLLLQRSIYSPREFGLVGDGVTDNSAKWADMMAAMPPTGAIVVWDGMEYYFASTITATKPLHHIGVPNLSTNSGKGTRWKFAAGAHFSIDKQVGGKYSGIVMTKAAAGSYVMAFVQADVMNESGSSYITFEDCYFAGECTVATVYMTNCLLILFDKCRFFNTYKAATTRVVWMDGSAFGAGGVRNGDNVDNVEFKTCIATGYQKVSAGDFAVRIDGFVLDGKCDSIKFDQCKALYCYYGIHLGNSGATTQVPNFTRWSQGGFENCYKNAIRAEWGDITTFSDMYASLDNDATSGSLYGNTDVVLVEPTYIGAIDFTTCQMRGGKRSAYRFEGGRPTITGGQAANSGLLATGYSVDVLSTVNSLMMTGMDCRTLATGSTGQTFAVRNLKGATNVIINGCNLSGYSSGAFQSGGTGTGITGNLL